MSCLFQALRSVKGIGWYTAGAVLNAALSIAIPFFLGAFVDSLVYGKPNPALAFSILAAVSMAALLIGFAMNDFVAVEGNRFPNELRKTILRKTNRIALSRLDGTNANFLAAKFHQDTATAGQLIGSFYGRGLGLASSLLFAWILVLAKRPLICLAFLAPLPLALWLAARHQKQMRDLARQLRLSYQNLYKKFDGYLRALSFLRVQNADAPYRPDPIEACEGLARTSIANNKASFLLANEQRILLFLGEFSILAISGYFVRKGTMPIGDVVLFQTMFVALYSSLTGFFELLPSWEAIREAFQSLRELEKMEEELPGNETLSDNWGGEVRGDHLAFTYPGQKRAVFTNRSFHIHPGQLVALTGANGTGKTTLLKIICSYMAPVSGTLYYGPTSSENVQKSSLRDRIGIVFQDQLLLRGTIRDNITLRNNRYTSDDIARALDLSNARGIIERFPEGIEHPIDETSPLSGGERQKIALARALIRKPKLLILDEVSNHLDADSRQDLSERLRAFKGKMTVILVSHDPGLLDLCDQTIAI